MSDLVISAADVEGRIIPPQDHATRPPSVRRISFGRPACGNHLEQLLQRVLASESNR